MCGVVVAPWGQPLRFFFHSPPVLRTILCGRTGVQSHHGKGIEAMECVLFQKCGTRFCSQCAKRVRTPSGRLIRLARGDLGNTDQTRALLIRQLDLIRSLSAARPLQLDRVELLN